MRLTPTERDRLLIFTAAELARARRARGLLLNVPEATALIADTVCEAARDGARLADAIEAGRSVLGVVDVLPGVVDVVADVKVEAVFDDATRLAVVTDPFRSGERPPVGAGEVHCHGHGSRSGAVAAPVSGPGSLGDDAPGAVIPGGPAVDPYADADPVPVPVTNTSEVPISVTSHFHFFETNPRLRFDRAAGYGRRLAIPAGSTVRFDPGATVEVRLVPIGGARVAIGFAGLVDGPLDAPGAREEALRRAYACGYLGAEPAGGADSGSGSDPAAGSGTAAGSDAVRGFGDGGERGAR
ncbi:urease subunit gamma [Embleya hyalina]|uniref:urease n=1 Tax=Embleya hyalina TaxID=516124 RepID=A0A401Z0C2_9ACTN|nr:urease subunit gamma [Embleya hyalina]GCE00350.1 urease subunit gamma/beta [Embleya hyalina]